MTKQHNLDLELPEDRPVGGYCKPNLGVLTVNAFMLPEDRPVGGYCKDGTTLQLVNAHQRCQRIDPLEGTARMGLHCSWSMHINVARG